MNYSAVVASIALFVSSINLVAYYYTNLYVHRNLFITITSPAAFHEFGTASRDTMSTILNLDPVIQNTGNSTEVILKVSYGIRRENGEVVEYPAGPFVLKAGDATTVPLKMGFDALSAFTQEPNGSDIDTVIHISFLDPNERFESVDIPVAKVHVEQSKDPQMIKYEMTRSPSYKDGPINLLSSYGWFKGI